MKSHLPTLSRCTAQALRALLIGLCCHSAAPAACPPSGESLASLQALKTNRWVLPEPGADIARQTLALALLDCLSDADPVLRDELAFEGVQAWMRAGQISESTLQALRTSLLQRLAEPADAAGFGQPFAALVLADVARVDRLKPYLLPEERTGLVEGAALYLESVRDYRGFDAREGWRHGVAHGADLLLQLSLNPQLTRPQADRVLAAIAVQVLPPGEHFYRYGEGQRLMAPVFYLARRGLLQAADWDTWFDGLAKRLAATSVRTQAGLAARHNLGSFVLPMYASVQESTDADIKPRLLPALRKTMKLLN